MNSFMKLAGVMLALTICLMVIPADAVAQCPGGICNLQPSPAFVTPHAVTPQTMTIQPGHVAATYIQPVQYGSMRSHAVMPGHVLSQHDSRNYPVGYPSGCRPAITGECSSRIYPIANHWGSCRPANSIAICSHQVSRNCNDLHCAFRILR